MDKLYANILNESEKIFAKKKTVIYLILSAIICIAVVALIPVFQSKFGITAVNAKNLPVTILNMFTAFFIPLFIIMLTTDIFSAEINDKSIKMVLTRPITRTKVFASKNIAILICVIINLFIVLIMSLICELFYKLPGSFSAGLLSGIAALLSSIVPQFTLITFVALICQFFNSSTSAFATSIFILIVSKVLSFLFPAISRILFINYFDWSTLWLSSSTTAMRLLITFMLLFSYGIIFFTIGLYIFDKKEI